MSRDHLRADISNGLDAKDTGLVLAFAMMGAVAFQIVSQFQLRKAAFSSALTGALYFKKLGQNRLVIQSLVDETEKQEMKGEFYYLPLHFVRILLTI